MHLWLESKLAKTRLLAIAIVLLLTQPQLLSSASGDHIIETQGKSISPFDLPSVARAEAYINFTYNDAGGHKYSRAPHPTKGYLAIFPPCSRSSSTNCVEGLSARQLSGTWQEGTLQQSEPSGLDGFDDITYEDGTVTKLGEFPEDASKGIMAGGKMSTWSIPGVPHSAGMDYGVSVFFSNMNEGTRSRRFRIEVIPLKWNAPQRTDWIVGGVRTFKTIVDYSRAAFIDDTEFQLRVKLGDLSSLLPTWFYSRTREQSLSVRDGMLTAIARPGTQPIVQSDYFSCPHSRLKALPLQFWIHDHACDAAKRNSSKLMTTGFSVGINKDAETLGYFSVLDKNLHMVATETSWWFESIQDSSFNPLAKCAVAPISGVGSSNALIFTTTLPRWDENLQELIYEVASPSVNTSGESNYGYFNLNVSESFAKCVWGVDDFSKYQASITVTGAESNRRIVTSTIGRAGGEIRFRISGLGFSTPKIKVNFSRTSSGPSNLGEISTPSATPSATPTEASSTRASTKKSITCVKGKAIRKVTVRTCPAGFKKR